MKIFLPLILFLVSTQEQIYLLWSTDLEQQRPAMHLDQRLVDAANFKARLLAETGKWTHCIDGYCPNKMIKDFGCKVSFDDKGNQVESLLIGEQFPGNAVERLKNSPSHRIHILGLDPEFKQQDEIGVGYYEYENNYYYVFISANCEE